MDFVNITILETRRKCVFQYSILGIIRIFYSIFSIIKRMIEYSWLFDKIFISKKISEI